jgi:hypothetical protein
MGNPDYYVRRKFIITVVMFGLWYTELGYPGGDKECIQKFGGEIFKKTPA